jgi:peroxiredoxin
MGKYIAVLIAVFLSTYLYAQPVFPSRNITIRGEVKHRAYNSFDLAVTGFIGNDVINVPFDRHGRFSKTIPLTQIQDLYLYLNNDAITIFAVPGDTIEMHWDEKKFAESFTISSPDSERQKELNLMYNLYKSYKSTQNHLLDLMFDRTVADSTKIEKVRNSLTGMLNTISNYTVTAHIDKIIYDVCFRMVNYLRFGGLYEKCAPLLFQTIRTSNIPNLNFVDINDQDFIDTKFYESPNYRDFLYDQGRTNSNFFKSAGRSKNYVITVCEGSLVLFAKNEVIRDWFLSKYLINQFSYSSFDNAEAAYLKFYPDIKRKEYSDTLEHFYFNIQKLRPGSVAPAFTLPDENGDNHSLSDFKGKLVYIDFWDPACAPCIADIKNEIPKLHEKYDGRNIVFVNICVDDKITTWKEYLLKLNLSGINLKNERWKNEGICKDYNINSIPHYVLIDQQGNIVDPNAPRPQQLNHSGENVIDRLLK